MRQFLDHPVAADLLVRSHRLGADKRVTNWGGGNTSSKARLVDPLEGEQIEAMWVKGSGGDLGTLTSEGLSVLSVSRLRKLKDSYLGPQDEDRMHDLLQLAVLVDGPPPSIDTAMHGLLDVAHVDHVHPDAIISIAASVDGEELTSRCFGDEVAWMPWRRPGFQLAVMIEELAAADPKLVGVVLGGHGLTAWGATSEECEQTTWRLISKAEEFIRREGRAHPLGSVRSGYGPLAETERRERAAALAPHIRGLASTDQRVVGHWTDDDLVTDFIGRESAPLLVPLGTSCPDHFIRTKIRPLLLDLPSDAPLEAQVERLGVLHSEYRTDYQNYYARHARDDTPAIRSADPAIFLIPGLGMFSFGVTADAARKAGEFYRNAINVIRGAEAVSEYQPIPESERFDVEYWTLEDRKLQSRPNKPLTGRVAVVTGAASGIGLSIAERLREAGAVIAIIDIDLEKAEQAAKGLGQPDSAMAVQADVGDEVAVAAAFAEIVRTFGGVDLVVNNAGLSVARSLLETTVDDWEAQYRTMARGSFLVSKVAVRVMVSQGIGGDLVYVVSKNAVVAGPDNLAYGSAKASQAHQVRLLAAELGAHGIRVNAVNPDGVVQGSGIFSGEWGVDRARTYGVPVDELGQFYASRTLLGKEVLPQHVADAVLILVSGGLSRTTGLTIPVDGGLVSAFLR